MKRFGPLLLATALLCLGVLSSNAQVIRVACIGDSITRGYGLNNDAVNAYPPVVGRLLGTNYQVRNFGVDGTTLLRKGSSPNTPYWTTSAFINATNYNPNIVTIMLGTNDSTTNNWRWKAEFEQDLSDMIDVFANLPAHPRIFVCAPVPAYGVQWDITPEVIRGEIIPKIKRVAQRKNVTFVNTHTPLTGRAELFPDWIHPNESGEAIIARTLHSALVN